MPGNKVNVCPARLVLPSKFFSMSLCTLLAKWQHTLELDLRGRWVGTGRRLVSRRWPKNTFLHVHLVDEYYHCRGPAFGSRAPFGVHFAWKWRRFYFYSQTITTVIFALICFALTLFVVSLDGSNWHKWNTLHAKKRHYDNCDTSLDGDCICDGNFLSQAYVVKKTIVSVLIESL